VVGLAVIVGQSDARLWTTIHVARELVVEVRLILCLFLGYAQVSLAGHKGQGTPLTHLFGGRKSKLLPDGGDCLGSGICAPSADSSLSGPMRPLCLCVWLSRQVLLLKDLNFLLLTWAWPQEVGWRPL
jgi:hypothetical protein